MGYRRFRWLAPVGFAALVLVSAGCFDDAPNPNIPVGLGAWQGPNYDALDPLPADTALLIASHRSNGSELNYDALFITHVKYSDGKTVDENRATQVREKVLFQGRQIPGSKAMSKDPLDLTEFFEKDLMRYVKTTEPSGTVAVDMTPTLGAIDFGYNSVPIVGFTTLPMDMRRCPIATCPNGPASEPLPFDIHGGLLHYLLPHFPPSDGPTQGLFRAGGTWTTRLPVYYPLASVDPRLLDACRFMLLIHHTLEGYRQGGGQVLAKITYTYDGKFDSKDPAVASRFPPGWNSYHVIYDTLHGEGTAIVDVGHGEIIWKHEVTTLDLKEARLVPPDPSHPDPNASPQGHWEKSSKTIEETATVRKLYPRPPAPPELQ